MKINKVPKAERKAVASPLALDRFLPYRLSVVWEVVSRLLATRYEERFGLTIPEWRIIAVTGERGEQTTQQIIDRTRMDRVRASRAVIRLSDKGLITRIFKPSDQRAQILDLSAQGVEVYRKIVPLAQSFQAQLSAALTVMERKQLDTILDKLAACAEQLGGMQGKAG